MVGEFFFVLSSSGARVFDSSKFSLLFLLLIWRISLFFITNTNTIVNANGIANALCIHFFFFRPGMGVVVRSWVTPARYGLVWGILVR